MAELLRRILWQFPVLIAGGALLFLCLGSLSPVKARLARPLFYNPTPVSAQVATKRALTLAKSGDPHGAEQLRQLGGAALPLLLEELPGLTVAEQRLVSSALDPIAERMQLRDKHQWRIALPRQGIAPKTAAADRALLFWERYREEHALDLRPLATSRLVKRAAQRDSRLQNADLLAVDTYALPTLVGSLGRISNKEDVKRARRLVEVIAHVTGKSWKIDAQATPTEARKVVTAVRRFWDAEGGQWTQLERFELLVARFSQTEFASWVFRTARQMTGLDHRTLAEDFSRRTQSSVPLGAFCLLGVLLLGPAVAATIQVLQLRQTRWQLERLGLRAGLSAGLVALLPLLISPSGGQWLRLSLLSLVMGTVFSAFLLSRELNDRMDWRTHHVLRTRTGLRKVAAITRWLAPSIPTLTPIAVAEASVWVTCLETSSKTEGLGWASLQALKVGDLDFLMAIGVALGVTTAIAQIFADVLLGTERVRLGET